MTLLNAGFEVAPSGTAIPTTGGPDGFNDGYTGSGTAFVSDSSVAAAVVDGSLAGKMSVGSSAAEVNRGFYLSTSAVYIRNYLYLTAAPNARFTWWSNWTPTQLISRILINTDLTVGLSDGTTSTFTTAPIPLNTLVRLEASFDHAAGTMSLDLYSGNSTTPISGGSVSVTGATFQSTSIGAVYGGVQSTLTNFTIRTDAWAVSDTGRVGPVVTGGSIPGATATVTASAPAGSVTAVAGGTVTITGVTPQVVAQGGVRPIPPAPSSFGAVWPPDPYRKAIRSGSYALTYLIDASHSGVPVPVAGATGLRPTGGTITDTTKPGVRRVLNLDLAPEPGLFDLLSPIGTALTVTARITYLNRQSFDIPMGVFDIDSESLSVGGGGSLSLTAPDKWSRIQRAKFIGPGISTPGRLVVDQIAQMIRDALGQDEQVAVSATSQAVMGPMVWDKDRDKAITDLATSIGAWVFFDRNGQATIADIPTIGSTADWLIDASPSGVLVELNRERSRAHTYNVVVVSSSASANPFNMQVAWDSDPASPTYAGTNPMYSLDAGPFGVVTYYYDTPLPLDDAGALQTAKTILSRTVGLAAQVSLGQVPNPAMDAFHVFDVLPPRERYDIQRVLERHVVDTVTHPLTLGTTQRVDGRSTRTDAYS